MEGGARALLGPFLAFFFPAICDEIDWARGYQSLDKELHQIVRDARVRRRLADKLFKVWRKNGAEAWLLIHIEVQGRREAAFPERMFVYSYRIYDRYRRPVVSLAVLCDDDPRWKPDYFGYNIGGCEVGIRFPVAKLLDFRGLDEQLEGDPNLFAPIVLAQLKAMDTRHDPAERHAWKVRLIKGLYQRGLDAEKIRQLFRLIDWMLALPQEFEDSFWAEICRFEEERAMPYVTSVERIGIRKGLREGLLEGITLALETKFGKADKQLLEELRAVTEVSQLRKLARALKKATVQEELRGLGR